MNKKNIDLSKLDWIPHEGTPIEESRKVSWLKDMLNSDRKEMLFITSGDTLLLAIPHENYIEILDLAPRRSCYIDTACKCSSTELLSHGCRC